MTVYFIYIFNWYNILIRTIYEKTFVLHFQYFYQKQKLYHIYLMNKKNVKFEKFEKLK